MNHVVNDTDLADSRMLLGVVGIISFVAAATIFMVSMLGGYL